MNKYTIEEKRLFITIFKNNATDVSRSCKAYGIDRKTFYAWYNDKEDSTFREWVDEERETIKDFGESQLLTLMKGIPKLDKDGKMVGWISRPDTACIIFFNKTKNKDRGYDERQVIKREGNWLESLNIQVTSPEQAQQLKEFLSTPDDGGKADSNTK